MPNRIPTEVPASLMEVLRDTWWQLERIERGTGSATGAFVTFRYGAMSFRVYLSEITYEAPVPLPREARDTLRSRTQENPQTDRAE